MAQIYSTPTTKENLICTVESPSCYQSILQDLGQEYCHRTLQTSDKVQTEEKAAKKERIKQLAIAQVKAQKDKSLTDVPPPKKPNFVKYGINHITSLIEHKKAQLVVIANDVDPIELVIWLPALCRKMQVPYCIVKGKARLGAVVGKKTATALALVNVNNQDKNELATLTAAMKESFNDRFDEVNKQWGGRKLGLKSQHALQKTNRKIQASTRGLPSST